MYIGICQLECVLYGAQSLKDKRQVIQSVCQKIRGKYPVSIAEVDGLDKWQRAVFGISLVSNDSQFIEKVLTQIMSLMDDDHRFEITKIDKEIEKVSWE